MWRGGKGRGGQGRGVSTILQCDVRDGLFIQMALHDILSPHYTTLRYATLHYTIQQCQPITTQLT